jgi:opacity protein-like surface antigen
MRPVAVILVVFMFLGLSGVRQPVGAAFNPSEMLQPQNRSFTLAIWTVGSIGFSALAYYLYKNSPAERAKGYPENLGLGEWYVAGYSGLSYLPGADWNFLRFPAPYQGRIAKNIEYKPGVLGGVKFGRFFDAYPWFGVEFETNFSRQRIREDQGRISPPLAGGPTNALGGSDWFMIWDMQVNLLARYGFLQDKEIPFGHLQPYIGIGPGFEIMYGRTDSAKNFAYEALAGIRYMCTQDIGLFCEYKFSYQAAVEYEGVLIANTNSRGTMQFDVPHHRFVIGVSYHFKNLYGN